MPAHIARMLSITLFAVIAVTCLTTTGRLPAGPARKPPGARPPLPLPGVRTALEPETVFDDSCSPSGANQAAPRHKEKETSAVRWPRFRGPNGSGVADGNRPPVQFGLSVRLLWKCPLPPGHSSPIIWDDHIFLTGLENARLVVIAIRRQDGTPFWQRTIPTDKLERVHDFSSPAASTPATDGRNVYVYVGSYGLLAYDFQGNEKWRMPLPPPPTNYGTATSPILHDGKIILQRDGNSTGSELIAVDAQTGSVSWRTPRPLLRDSYSTPMIWSHDGREEIITIGNGKLVAYSASDGAERWWIGGLTSEPIALAVTGGGLLFTSSRRSSAPGSAIELPPWDMLVQKYDINRDGKLAEAEVPEDIGVVLRKEVPRETPGNYLSIREALRSMDGDKDGLVTMAEWNSLITAWAANEDYIMAIRPGGNGDSTNSHVLWRGNRGISEIPSPILYRGRLYFVRDGSMVTSYVPETGKIVLDRVRLGALGQYCASLVAADGKIYAASVSGTVTVFRAGDQLEVLARNDLGDIITATPAIAGDRLYIRTAKYLLAFGENR